MEKVALEPEPTHWAILIGAGVTKVPTASSRDSPSTSGNGTQVLRGSVADVVTTEKYLKDQSTDSQRMDIKLLTAGESPSNHGPKSNSQPEPELPTYKNVVSALHEVINRGKSGQFVLIHFSGHGTRLPRS